MEQLNKYWLCCGSVDPMHNNERARGCVEAKRGRLERCQFGTLEDHVKMIREQEKERREDNTDSLESFNDLKQEVKNMVCENRDLENERDGLRVDNLKLRNANSALLRRVVVQSDNIEFLEKEIKTLKGVIEHLELTIDMAQSPPTQTTLDERLDILEKKLGDITKTVSGLYERTTPYPGMFTWTKDVVK